MTALRHPEWYLFAEQRFRRRGGIELSVQEFRGETYVVLADKLTGQYLRLAAGARDFWQRLDGRRTTQELWQDFMRHPATAPTQFDMAAWILQLVQQGFLLSDHTLNPHALGARQAQRAGAQIEQRAASPLSIKVKLFDPDPIVRLCWPVARHLFTPAGAVLLALLFAVALVLGGRNLDALMQGGDAALVSQSGLVSLAIVYPLMKAIHELAHCLTLYFFGGRVREFGVMLLVLFPVPYVDASEALALPDKRARMLVAAAGILAELAMASIALLLWLVIEPGIERALLFNVIVIGSVSTLLFNGNPLLKFDAYYVMADALELPNLAARSSEFLADLFRTRILGLRPEFVAERRETPILAVYGSLSLGYRVLLTATIAFLVSGWFYIIGVMLGIWAFISGLFWPMAKTLHGAWQSARAQSRLPRAFGRLTLAVVLAAGVFLFLPLPFSATGTGRIIPLAEARIIAGTAGQVTAPPLDEGQPVRAGQPLLHLDDPEASARVASLMASTRFLAEAAQRSGLAATEQQMIRREAALMADMLAEAETRAAAADVTAPLNGRLVWAGGKAPLRGSYLYRGQVLGHVIAPDKMQAVVALPASFSGISRDRIRGLSAYLPDGRVVGLTVQRDQVVDVGGVVPAELLVSAGGSVPENPENPGRALDTVWVVWATGQTDLTDMTALRIEARLDLGYASAAAQLWHYTQRLFLRALRL